MRSSTLTTVLLLLAAVMLQAQPRYDMQHIQREHLNRGVVAIRSGKQVVVSWRTLSSDAVGQPFSVYRNGRKLTQQPLREGGTFYIDQAPLASDATYEVRGGARNGRFTLRANAPEGYLPIKLQQPAGGTTPDGKPFGYTANDASVADVDGDGQYEIVLKWDPTNAHDNAHDGYTGPTLFDCYRLDGTLLWRIDLGINLRSGAHYTPFIFYDLDGDGRAEFMVRTSDGTRDGKGRVIGDAQADYRHRAPADAEQPLPTPEWAKYNKQGRPKTGRILTGNEYLTVFDGLTGTALATQPYVPERGNLSDWGDNYANRSDRFLAAVGYLDGKHASAIFCRGYYTRTVLAAWDWDGRELKQHWVFDTLQPAWAAYAGQGNHNLRVADVDGDGCDEITYGSMAVDHDGRGLYNTGMGHGDAIHLMCFNPQSTDLQVWDCHENRRDGSDFRDARTGKVIFQVPSKNDVGRCMAADIDPTNPGLEMWSTDSHGIRTLKGEVLYSAEDPDNPQHKQHLKLGGRYLSVNFGIWWDGDLLRELLDHEAVSKYDWQNHTMKDVTRFDGVVFNNWTKSNPCLSADILGDWREEVVARTPDNSELRIYVSPIPTAYRINSLMEDIPYRLSTAAQNVGYNQPSEPGFYLGPDPTVNPFLKSLQPPREYQLTEPAQPKAIRSDHLRMGGANPKGERIDINNFYMSMAGKPVIPVMGEFHFSRYPAEQWEEEILKMKAGGVTVIPTYVFWSLHEEVEGQFRWDGQRNLRRFVELCQKHDMAVIVRIGPFCHGEIRSGGFPDWLFAKPLEVRSNDPEYLKLVKHLYTEIGKQLQGLYYKDGGPIIGCQVENEMQHSAAPWAICYPGEPKDNTAASYNAGEAMIGVGNQARKATGAEMGTLHMQLLKQMAVEAGIDVPFYTATGWGNAAVIEGEAIPVTAAYTYPFWAKPHMSKFLMFKDLTKEADYAPTRYNPADYPSFCAEMGAGIQMIYSARPIVTAEAAEGLMVRTLGSGSNGIGYYMYHGGSTPKQIGGVGSFQDEPMGMPKISYDFQAPIGEFGLEGKMYRNLRLLHTFLADFGHLLAPMEPVLPADWQQMTPGNRDHLRYAARIKDGSGFLFMVNFQDHDTLRHDQSGVVKLNLKNETISIPVTLPKDESMILPFNLDMDGALLKYATAQLLMKLQDKGTPHYIFFAPEGVKPEFVFAGGKVFRPVPGFKSTFTYKGIKVTTLTRQQALNALKVNGKLLITDATVLPTADGATLLSLGNHQVSYVVYPSKQGFKAQTASVAPVEPQFEVKQAGPRRMSVKVLDNGQSSQVQEYFLRINYVGDVAMAFMKGQLVQDEFYHGEPWTIGLKRYADDLKTDPLTFYFRPLRKNAPFLGDLPQKAVPDFEHGPVVDIQQVEVIPEYKFDIRF